MDAPLPADMDLPAEADSSLTATTVTPSSGYVSLAATAPLATSPDMALLRRCDLIQMPLPNCLNEPAIGKSHNARLASTHSLPDTTHASANAGGSAHVKDILAEDVAHIESLVRKEEEAERRARALRGPNGAAVKTDALQSHFHVKPDFVLPSDFFSGLPPVVLKRYCDKVKTVTGIDYLIRSSEVELANGEIQLRLVAPAHCGFKEYTGESTARNNSLVQWEAAAGALVEKLRDAHGWAPLAFNLSIAE